MSRFGGAGFFHARCADELPRRRPAAIDAFRRAAGARERRGAARLHASPTRPTARSTPARSNAVLVCHALNASHHVAGTYAGAAKSEGWWDNLVGPGKPLDTERFFVIGVNNPGSCFGSTGPASPNPDPAAQRPRLRQRLSGRHGRGLGRRAGAPRRSARHRAAGGRDRRQPRRHAGARLVAALSRAAAPVRRRRDGAQPVGAEHRLQRSGAAGDRHRPRLPRRPLRRARRRAEARPDGGADDRPHHLPLRRFDGGQVRPRHAGRRARATRRRRSSSRSRPTCATRATSSASTSTPTPTSSSPARSTTSTPRAAHGGDLTATFAAARCKFQLVSFTTDWRFAPARSREIVKALVDNRRDVSYAEIDAPHGHDAFLLDDPRYHGVMRACFANLAQELA